ncbi:MAG: MFS transporter [Flavobacteriales bacterium]|nr:MFS transporter [Flavobacteriales bacterium]
MSTKQTKAESVFTPYQKFVIAILSILQFTIVLDFMVLSPLGAQLLDELDISPSQFGAVVSAYAFSAGSAGILAAGFADKFDRKKLLIFFYFGFIAGTCLCALAPDYNSLLIARIVTGLFGGVMGSISFAIITDLFKLQVRGRVMGFVQMAFAASQVLGIPIGLWLANRYGWHSPFWMIVFFSILVAVLIIIFLKPIDEHLKEKSERNAFVHLYKTITKPAYVKTFLATTLLATGGFMLMPFGSAFSTNNLGLTLEELPLLYGITGIFSIVFGPVLGKLSDRIGKYKLFLIGSLISMVLVGIYTNLNTTPFALVVLLNVILFIGISSRIISSSALITAIPDVKDRGAFMSTNSAVQQISGGIAAAFAGTIVVQTESGFLENYNILGYIVIGSVLITIFMMRMINNMVMKKELAEAGIEIKDE